MMMTQKFRPPVVGFPSQLSITSKGTSKSAVGKILIVPLKSSSLALQRLLRNDDGDALMDGDLRKVFHSGGPDDLLDSTSSLLD
jgi:hypothetical protein